MRVVITIIDTELVDDGASYKIKYQMSTDLNQGLVSDLEIPEISTDAAINQAIIDDARNNLEVAAGMVFVVGDTLAICNVFSSQVETVATATAQSVIDIPSQQEDLNTLLTAEGLI